VGSHQLSQKGKIERSVDRARGLGGGKKKPRCKKSSITIEFGILRKGKKENATFKKQKEPGRSQPEKGNCGGRGAKGITERGRERR